MGSCDVKKQVRFAVFPYVVEIPPRGPEWDEDDEEGFFSGEEEWEEEESDFVEPVQAVRLACYFQHVIEVAQLIKILAPWIVIVGPATKMVAPNRSPIVDLVHQPPESGSYAAREREAFKWWEDPAHFCWQEEGWVLAQRTLRPGQDVEEALTDALRTQNRRRYEYDSDDAASETSSVCSERSYRSIGQTSEYYLWGYQASSTDFDKWYYRLPTPTQDTTEIIALLGSGSHGDRKEGLIALQNLLRNGRFLSRVELQKCASFYRMFHDPHSKVLSLFLDTLVDLIQVHSQDLTNQMFPFLTRLLNKSGQDLLGSVQNRVQRALDAVRENFPAEQQFSALSKYIVDQTQSASLKVKASLLNYMHNLVLVMNDTDFVNSADTRLVLSRIINFTTEPKSVEVRKAAQLVLIDLFNLNAPELSMMLTNLPKPFQDSATKILQTHMRSASRESRDSTSDVLSPKNVTPQQNRSRPPSRGHHDEMETENMNPEDIYNSIKQTTADIQNLSFHSKLEGYDPVKKKREFTSQDSGIQDLRNDSPDAVIPGKATTTPPNTQMRQ
uniref:Uncharacterized protein n=1 Tax=Magallana gigas TaxID=29159 RepID=A0A8W8N870_MAGGI